MGRYGSIVKRVLAIGIAILGDRKAAMLVTAAVLIIVFDFLAIALLIPLMSMAQDGTIKEFISRLFDYEADAIHVIQFSLLSFLLFILIKNLILFFSGKFKYQCIFEIQQKLSSQILATYLQRRFDQFRHETISIFARNVISETGHFVSTLTIIIDTAIEVSIFVAIFILVGFQTPILYLFLLFFVLFGLLIFGYTRNKLFELGANRVQCERERLGMVQSVYNLFSEIKVYRAERYFLKKYEGPNKVVANSHAVENTVRPIAKHVYEILTIFFLIAYVTIFFSHTNFETNLILVAVALLRSLPSFNKIATSVQQFTVHVKSIDGILDVLSSGSKAPGNTNILTQPRSPKVKGFCYELERLQVADKVFVNMRLVLKESDHLVLLRADSGFGKTVFLGAMVGLIDADGRYTVNDSHLMPNELLKLNLFSYNSQSARLLNDTVLNNILFDTDECDSERLETALRLSNLKEIIEGFPNGMNTVLSDKGNNLSGGQQQRITLARTIYKMREIMVLDESLSALDNASQLKILQNLRDQYPGKVILVSHDLMASHLFDSIISWKR